MSKFNNPGDIIPKRFGLRYEPPTISKFYYNFLLIHFKKF